MYTSLALFAVGGLLGAVATGGNTIVPAHYHGAIVGVTLAFMGMTYTLLPIFGYAKPATRAARWQPYVYGAGQLLHITGLTWSGVLGVGRKVAGEAQQLDGGVGALAMGLAGTGGLIAIIGGILFVWVVGVSVWQRWRGVTDA